MTKGVRSCSVEAGDTVVRGLDGPSVLLQRIDSILHATHGNGTIRLSGAA